MNFLVLINTTLFILLSFLHFYWALGGNWGMEGVLPSLSEGRKVFKPGLYGTLGVGAAMGIAAFITMCNTGIFDLYLNHNFICYATIAIGVVFCLRAIGDFRYVGFFKKATGTLFAKNDTYYYSPLCLLIAVISFLIVAI
jgi:hypothetical protein